MFANCEAIALPREWRALEPELISWHQHHEEVRIVSILAAIDQYVFEQADEGESVVEQAFCDPTDRILEDRFREQAEKWERETKYLSSTTKRAMHPSYQTIIGMGHDVVPLLLRDLQQNRRTWFWALSYITQENPINPADAGKMDKMIMAWVNWGRERGLL